MELAVHFIDFLPGDPAKLGPTLADAAKAAEQGGATLFTLADHFFQMENSGRPRIRSSRAIRRWVSLPRRRRRST